MHEKLQKIQSNTRAIHPMPREQRVKHLLAMKKMIEENTDQISQALASDLGKSDFEAWLMEINMMVQEIDHCLAKVKKWMKPKKVKTPASLQPAKSFMLPEPKGLVLVIGAWNYPFILSFGPMISAIVAGNAVALKPSELSPASSKLMAELVVKYMDTDYFACFEGDASVSQQLLEFPFDHIFYTGGGNVGKIVMKAAAEHLTPVTLELGGKSPAIIWDDKQIKTVAQRIAWGKWSNAGQTCIAPDYLLIKKGLKQQLIAELQKTLQNFYGDNPLLSSDYGKIVNRRHFDRLVSYLDNQKVILGGEVDESSLKIAPTIVDEPDFDSVLMQEEIFGPILPVIEVEQLEDAIQTINRHDKPLALYVFTEDSGVQKQVAERTSAGNMLINDTLVFMSNHHLPFGGIGPSGMGRYHGYWGFENMSHFKTVMNRSTLLDPPLRYPPFTQSKKKLMSMIYKLEKYIS